jgi:serine/threonine-protein kinase
MARSIGRYEIREELGRGGMGVVYLAEDSRLDRLVALKLLNQQLSADPSFAARFEREARTVAGLSHTAIVSLYDYGESDGWLYLVMPYMQGGTLKEAIARKALSPGAALNVLTCIGGALDKAHSQGIVHRDLKPANILLDEEEQPYLSDFGIVKMARAYKFVGDYQAMHKAYQQAIAVGAANDPFPYTNYAYNIYPDLASFDEAMAILYDCEANLIGNAHQCAWERANLSVTAGRIADTVAAYQRYLELVPQGAEAERQQQARDYISEHGS